MGQNAPLSRRCLNQHFSGLDGLRGVATFVVVFLHGMFAFDTGYIPDAACLAVDFYLAERLCGRIRLR